MQPMACEFGKYIIYFIGFFTGSLLLYFIYPWSIDTKFKKALLHLIPLISVSSYFFYEFKMNTDCTHIDIRIDIFLLWPVIGTMLFLYIVKIIFVVNNGK